MGITAEATTTTGRGLALRNPEFMTIEISEVLARSSGVRFRLTSLDPVVSDNAPDAWERNLLLSFQNGRREGWDTVETSGVPTLRYMKALTVEDSCLTCHKNQGYKVGDVRGGISVLVPLTPYQGQAELNAGLLGAFGVAATLLLFGATLALTRRLRGQLDQAQAALVEAATVDVLTGVATRRHAMALLQVEIDRAKRSHAPLALVMIDIDRLKDVNDTHGHAAGDAVLIEVARRIGDTLRPYDVFGRIGGEEFLIVSPGTGLAEAFAIAERARTAVSATPIDAAGSDVSIAASLGVALVDPAEDEALDRALARVDEALYAAKAKGRDQTSVVGSGD
jgi:diguanylate cyclase (GGDEF)-like protein